MYPYFYFGGILGSLLCYFLFEFHLVKTKMALNASVSSEHRVLNKVKVLSNSQRHITLNELAPSNL